MLLLLDAMKFDSTDGLPSRWPPLGGRPPAEAATAAEPSARQMVAAMEAMAKQVADSIVDVSDSVRFSRYKIYFRCSRL